MILSYRSRGCDNKTGIASFLLLMVVFCLVASPAFAGSDDEVYKSNPKCDPYSSSTLQYKIMDSTRQDATNRIVAARTDFENSIKEDIKNTGSINPLTGEPKNKYLRGKIRYSYCLDIFLGYFDIIKTLMSIGNMIAAAIAAIVTTILNFVCQFVANTINNVLSMMCLPLPNLNFGLDLALSSNRQSCDGISLANLISVGGGSPLSMPTTVPGYFNNMSRGITDPRTGHIRF